MKMMFLNDTTHAHFFLDYAEIQKLLYQPRYAIEKKLALPAATGCIL